MIPTELDLPECRDKCPPLYYVRMYGECEGLNILKPETADRRSKHSKSTSFSALLSSALPDLKDSCSEPCVPDSCLPNKGCIFEYCVR